jgi:glycerophosphoryl diester phosphodiesterase
MHHPLRIAHRGMPRQARENTLASFALALAAGADGIELDVHATSDDVVVVHHDAELAGGAAIGRSSYAEIAEHTSNGERIPTLRAVCALVKGRAELFVEIKGNGIENLVVRALEGYLGAVAIHSFDHALIRRLADGATPFRLGILLEEPVSDARATMESVGALDLWPHHPLVTSTLVSDVHRLGGRVIPWTVNDARDVSRVTALGVDGICTDDVTSI